MKVVDASALVEHLTGGEHAGAVRERIGTTSAWLWAPQLIDAEVGQALRGIVRAGKVSARAAGAALAELAELRMIRIEHAYLTARAWELRDNVSFYDGLYVALAEELDAPLITLDSRLAGAPGVRIEVDVVQAS